MKTFPRRYFLFLDAFHPTPPNNSASNIINQNNIICIFFARAKVRGELIP